MVSLRDASHKVEEPAKHVGLAYSGLPEFESRATLFLADGFDRGERLMYVADDPVEAQWPKTSVDRGDLLIRSTSEVYGPERLVDAASQRDTFESALADALHHGYTGMCVAGDNTSLIAGFARLSAWLRWESESERFMTENPVTGMCAFDRARTDDGHLQAAMGAHRAIAPPFS